MLSRLLGITPKAKCTLPFPRSPNRPLGWHFKRCTLGRQNHQPGPCCKARTCLELGARIKPGESQSLLAWPPTHRPS